MVDHNRGNFICHFISVIYKTQPNRPQSPRVKLKSFMSTSAQIAANQKNAELSTGPRTEAGRAVSSQNGVTHSLSSTFRVLMRENQAEFDALKRRIAEEHKPEGDN